MTQHGSRVTALIMSPRDIPADAFVACAKGSAKKHHLSHRDQKHLDVMDREFHFQVLTPARHLASPHLT
jgi:hypothetical protein